MIPIALVTGFLGSGKTTLLESLARRWQDRKIVWLINEFSARDMDASRLAAAGRDVQAIAGGSIFCRCKAAEFIGVLGRLPQQFSPEAVIIEASGMADPSVAEKMLRESGLHRHFEIATVLAVVDPGTFPKLLHTLPNIRAQIETATRVLINKIDLYPPSQIEQTEAQIRALRPGVPIARTCFAEAELDWFGEPAGLEPRGELAPCVDPRFATFETTLPGELDLERLQQAVASLAGAIYRIKGVAVVAGRACRIDYSGSGWRIEDIPATGSPAAALVFIARGPQAEAVRRLVREIAASPPAIQLPKAGIVQIHQGGAISLPPPEPAPTLATGAGTRRGCPPGGSA